MSAGDPPFVWNGPIFPLGWSTVTGTAPVRVAKSLLDEANEALCRRDDEIAQARTALGARPDEDIDHAARRVAQERDEALSESSAWRSCYMAVRRGLGLDGEGRDGSAGRAIAALIAERDALRAEIHVPSESFPITQPLPDGARVVPRPSDRYHDPAAHAWLQRAAVDLDAGRRPELAAVLDRLGWGARVSRWRSRSVLAAQILALAVVTAGLLALGAVWLAVTTGFPGFL